MPSMNTHKHVKMHFNVLISVQMDVIMSSGFYELLRIQISFKDAKKAWL